MHVKWQEFGHSPVCVLFITFVDFIPFKTHSDIFLKSVLLPQEILKLRKKITSTVQVLTHLKEKLQFVQAENQVQKGRLREVESEAAMVIFCVLSQ
jgi:hypothetical protein